ncbi:MAG: methyltransferase, partial [Patescibacteria group bacterium]
MTSPASNSKSSDPSLPEAYSEGNTEFLGCTIYLDSRPLIPRTETEWWTEKLVDSLQLTADSSIKVLDLFAGSGCIGVAVLKRVAGATIDFGELEARHLPTIQKNVLMNGVDLARSRVLQTDVFSAISGKYDYILANPPYLAESRMARIEDSVLAYEPKEALLAADDGFDLVRRTIQGALERLTTSGQLWI